jgi:hypothetical protein
MSYIFLYGRIMGVATAVPVLGVMFGFSSSNCHTPPVSRSVTNLVIERSFTGVD